MSTTSIGGRFVFPAIARARGKHTGQEPGDGCGARREPGLLEILSLSGWRMLTLETLSLLVLIAALRHWYFGFTQIPGLPHPYWIPVLLASSQYGVSGGMIATVAACVAYFFELSPQSATQNFYAYAATIAIQPTAWLMTALILGGLRSLHIYQAAELAERLATCRRCADDLADGLERATAEITALERRIATDTSSVAALSRSLSKIDLSDRRAAAASFGELFRVGCGASTFTLYLKSSGSCYLPVFAVKDNVACSTRPIDLLRPARLDALAIETVPNKATRNVDNGDGGAARHVVLIPPSNVSAEPLAAIVCQALHPSQDVSQFRRRADEFGRAFAAVLSACPDQSSGVPR